jgi:hypothetical protein
LSFVFPDQKSQQALLQKVDAQFERGADSKIVFYPNSARRSGYVVEPPTREPTLRDYALRRKKIDQILTPLSAIVIPLYFYTIGPRYPWWQALAICLGGIAVVAVPSWLWRRYVTAGLAKIGEVTDARKLWAIAALVAAALIFISVYQPPADLSLPQGAIAFYPDVGDPVLMMIGGAFATFFIDRRSVQMREKLGVARYGFTFGVCLMFAVGGLVWAAYTLSNPQPQILVTPTFLACDEGQVAWAHVTAISLAPGGRTREYAKVTLDTVNPFLQGRTFNCEIDGTGAGYLAVYNAIEAAWQKAKEKPAP